MKENNLYISNIGKGAESSLVVVKDYDSEIVEVSLQNNKNITKNPKICLISKNTDFNKFIKKLEKELETHSTPDLYTVAQLYCSSMCEILRVIKVDNESYDVFMYYNYRRPFSKRCKDYVNFSSDELKKFIKGN